MAEIILARTELVALPGEAYRGARQRYFNLVLELCQQPLVASLLASQFSDFYRSLITGEKLEIKVIQDSDQSSIVLELEHDQRDRAHELVLGQRMKLSHPIRSLSNKWLTKILIPLGVVRSLNREHCQEILNQRSSEELSHEVSSTTEVLTRVREELNIAADIQRSFLVSEQELNLLSDGLDLGAMMTPSKEIGGDLYDCIALGAERYLLCIGDVSGKGVPAALTMSTCLTLVRSYSEVIDSPAAIMRRVNQRLAQNNSSCAFTTLFLGVINSRNGELRYCNAGHNPALVLRQSGAIDRLSIVHGPALGVVEDVDYGDTRISLGDGETLLVYTDGASEMFNANHQRLGLDGMEAVLPSLPTGSSSELVRHFMQALWSFAGSEPQHDDITLLAVRLKTTSADPPLRHELLVAMPNQLEGLSQVKTSINEFAQSHQLGRSLVRKVQVVADEVLGNILRYGCVGLAPTLVIEITITLTPDSLLMKVVDPGEPFNPLDAEEPDLDQPLEDRPIGGLGLHLVKQMTRNIAYQRLDHQNQLSMEFSLV
jgi:sigma-B regulation protein RsbU (phosphoserine phosphatase)